MAFLQRPRDLSIRWQSMPGLSVQAEVTVELSEEAVLVELVAAEGILDDKAEEAGDVAETGDETVDNDVTGPLDQVVTRDCDTGGVVVDVDFKEVVGKDDGTFVAGPVLGVDKEELSAVALLCCVEESMVVD